VFIAMNNFKVTAGREEDFERAWRERESYLKEVPGFVQFVLLKGDDAREYVSHSTWQDRDAFVAWTKSEAFAAGHRQGSLMGAVQGPPQLKTYEGIIVEMPEGGRQVAS
jgi:heme-degrading monooxygenase HmoA